MALLNLIDFIFVMEYNSSMLNFINSFKIFGLDIKFYGITMALAMLVGIIVACKNAKYRNLNSDNIYLIALYVLPLAIIGARLFFVLGSETPYTFIETLQIWHGGMSIFGGVMGGAVGVGLFCIIHKKNFLNIADVVCISLILGQAIGRWGNFFNQEVYGLAVESGAWQWFPFAVYIEGSGWHLALFFYEFVINLAICFAIWKLLQKTKTKGYVTSAYLVSYGAIRFLLEPLRVAQYNLMLFGLKLSMVTSGIAVIVGITLFVLIYTKSKREKHINET